MRRCHRSEQRQHQSEDAGAFARQARARVTATRWALVKFAPGVVGSPADFHPAIPSAITLTFV